MTWCVCWAPSLFVPVRRPAIISRYLPSKPANDNVALPPIFPCHSLFFFISLYIYFFISIYVWALNYRQGFFGADFLCCFARLAIDGAGVCSQPFWILWDLWRGWNSLILFYGCCELRRFSSASMDSFFVLATKYFSFNYVGVVMPLTADSQQLPL